MRQMKFILRRPCGGDKCNLQPPTHVQRSAPRRGQNGSRRWHDVPVVDRYGFAVATLQLIRRTRYVPGTDAPVEIVSDPSETGNNG
jgi:hypothetical protein